MEKSGKQIRWRWKISLMWQYLKNWWNKSSKYLRKVAEDKEPSAQVQRQVYAC